MRMTCPHQTVRLILSNPFLNWVFWHIDDFTQVSDGKKSVPLNIVIKVSSAGGRPAVKLSDNLGKNTGDSSTVVEVKKRLGYVEQTWKNGDETQRWGMKGD